MKLRYLDSGLSRSGCIALGAMLALLVPVTLPAAPVAATGDVALRHDIQVLADYGVVTAPVTSWPMSWGAIIVDLDAYEGGAELPAVARASLVRVKARARQEARIDYLDYQAAAAAASNPTVIRSFANTPREEAEISAGLSWTGDIFSVTLKATAVDSPADGEDFRADGSMVGVALGNWSMAASTMDRWWGPGWDGSLILSNNARPIPAFVIDRTLTTAFKSKWLGWMGPWDLSMMWGQLEKDRYIPNAQFFGMRLNFKPLPSLEIGLSRTAQWCGDGRPCGLGTFKDLLLGNDNLGDAGITRENEPGNQMAGVDIRYAPRWFDLPLAFYVQHIGEDEAGGLPSRSLSQFGVEVTGQFKQWSWRSFAELAGTSCNFLKEDMYNCAYDNGIYQTGYRYRGRVIGHGADNDAKLASIGLIMVNDDGNTVNALVRYGPLNRDGSAGGNSVASERINLSSFDVTHGRSLAYGRFDMGIGYERLENDLLGQTTSDSRLFVRWLSQF